MKKGAFLEGTKLTGYSEEKPKKKKKTQSKNEDTGEEGIDGKNAGSGEAAVADS